MKNFILAFFVTFLGNAQDINFVDPDFKAKLVNSTPALMTASGSDGNPIAIDANADGEISSDEALAVTSLYVPEASINNLDGIQYFTNLTTLNIDYNQIYTLDLSPLVNLKDLSCYNSGLNFLYLSGLNLRTLNCKKNYFLHALDVSGMTDLELLDAWECNLQTINVSGCTSLMELNVENSNLQELDVSGNVALINLIANGNQLQSLDVSGLANLQRLECDENQLTSLNINGCTSLSALWAMDNQISSLDASGCTSLYSIHVKNNNMEDLDLTGCTALSILGADNNNFGELLIIDKPNLHSLHAIQSNITSLIFSNCPNLSSISVSFNQLTTLDLTECTGLSYVWASANSLTSVYAKNGRNEMLDIGNWSGDLSYICADESQILEILENISDYPNAVINSYCSFTPGGDYNTILGHVSYDLDDNGCDETDMIVNNFKVNMFDGTTTGAAFTDNSGNYQFYTIEGDFTISPAFELPPYFNVTPQDAAVSLASTGISQTQDFCISRNGIHPDVEIVLVPLSPSRPGFDSRYELIYKNKGTEVASGSIEFTYQEDLMDYVSSTETPASQGSGIVTWNYASLMPFETRRHMIIININSPMDTPPVNIGDELEFEAAINPIAGDETPGDNDMGIKQTVVGSFDPNDKHCLKGSLLPTSEIGEYLHYVINFENTGTAAAENIVIQDIIDTSKFNVSTLQLLTTSHPSELRVLGNKVEFLFEGIQLGAGEHGHVVFKIKTLASLVEGDTASNKAEIFFDYNFPVETNIASTTFQSLGIGENDISGSISIYPNPTSGIANITSSERIDSISIFDVRGRIVLTKMVDDFSSEINISDLRQGIYIVKVFTSNETRIRRLLKQ